MSQAAATRVSSSGHPMLPPRTFCSLLCAFAATATPATALEIRVPSASRHDRFTGFPETPAVNTGSWFDGTLYPSVGWSLNDTRRQFALVSPRHVVLATHWGALGHSIRFLAADGSLWTATIESSVIISKSSTTTDLTLARLSAPAPAAFKPFPYLNLANESLYTNTQLQVFGFNARVGKGTLTGFDNAVISGITRLAHFDYPETGGDDDCVFIEGDSGSPSFAITGGRAAIVGVHCATDPLGAGFRNYDTFLPHYITELNEKLATDGYRMIPATVAPTTVSVSHTATPAQPRQLHAAALDLTFTNPTANGDGNVVVKLVFPAGAAPSSASGVDWFADAGAPDTLVFHRAKLPAGTSETLNLAWTAVPALATIPIQVTTISDASPSATTTVTLTTRPSYAAWSGLLTAGIATADPDQDGVPNVLEYAFGSDPHSGASGGTPAASVAEDGGRTVVFPIRDDAAVRGLAYVTQYSQDLVNWVMTPPSGATTQDAAADPPVAGFLNRSVHLPAGEERRFLRVRVELTE